MFSDSSYVVKHFRRRLHMLDSDNADLWHRLNLAMERRTGTLEVRKIKAHQPVEAVHLGVVELQHWIGNHFSDAYADTVAASFQVPDTEVDSYRMVTRLARALQARLVAANMQAVKAAGPWLKAPALGRAARQHRPRGGLKRWLADTTHVLPFYDDTLATPVLKTTVAFHCQVCQQKANARRFKRFLTTPCPGPAQPVRPQLEQPLQHSRQAGEQLLHPSHALSFKRGIWYCTRCGYYCSVGEGKSSAKKLAQPCAGVCKQAGAQYMSRLRKGLPPRPDMGWPQQDQGPVVQGQGPAARRRLA